MNRPEIITMGCRLNAFESEVMAGHLDRTAAAAAAGAGGETVIVNTCAVTGEATRQARQTVRKARRDNPEARLVVTGCAAQIEPDMFAAMPEVDVVLGNAEKLDPHRLAAALDISGSQRVQVGDIMAVHDIAGHLISGFSDRARAFVQIQNGCDHRCTFCIIPYGRGPSRSVPAGAVIDQIRALVENGLNEVVLTGVDLTSYGADLPGTPSLGRLVCQILKLVPELARLRLSSIDSIEADDHLLRALAEHERLMPHLHLSLQAGDDIILKRMKRRHLRDHSIAFCEHVRQLRPDVTFGADLIAGFPTETDDMFQNTCRLIEQCGLTFLHVFPFSPRPGTPAAQMPQLDKSVIRERAQILRGLGDSRLAQHLAALNGARREVLVEHVHTGHAPDFTAVRLDRPQQPGSLVEVEIYGAEASCALGRAA
jgi:threonylcarbamoyladenosine tRNA methylthiotransferase MtaB